MQIEYNIVKILDQNLPNVLNSIIVLIAVSFLAELCLYLHK